MKVIYIYTIQYTIYYYLLHNVVVRISWVNAQTVRLSTIPIALQ